MHQNILQPSRISVLAPGLLAEIRGFLFFFIPFVLQFFLCEDAEEAKSCPLVWVFFRDVYGFSPHFIHGLVYPATNCIIGKWVLFLY